MNYSFMYFNKKYNTITQKCSNYLDDEIYRLKEKYQKEKLLLNGNSEK